MKCKAYTSKLISAYSLWNIHENTVLLHFKNPLEIIVLLFRFFTKTKWVSICMLGVIYKKCKGQWRLKIETKQWNNTLTTKFYDYAINYQQ